MIHLTSKNKLNMVNYIFDCVYTSEINSHAFQLSKLLNLSPIPVFFHRGKVFRVAHNIGTGSCNLVPDNIKAELDALLDAEEQRESNRRLVMSYLRDTFNKSLNEYPGIEYFPACMHPILKAANDYYIDKAPRDYMATAAAAHLEFHAQAITIIKTIFIKRIIRGEN